MKKQTACGGPVNTVTGRCGWCKRPTSSKGVCEAPWPDRPVQEVYPEMTAVPLHVMRFKCWHCERINELNSLTNADIIKHVASGEVASGICQNCGRGIDLVQRRILTR